MQGQVDKFSGTLKKLASTVALAFGTAALINFGKESVKAASELSDAWMGLQSIVEGQGRSFQRAKSFVEEYVSDGLVPLTDAVKAYKNLAARRYSDEQIQKTMVALKDAAAFGRQSTYTLGKAVATAAEGLKNENSILVDNAGVTKNVAKMWDEYAKSIGTTANKLTQQQKIQAEVNGILEETKFQTGDAAKLVNTYSGQIAMLGYNFQQLKVAVGNAIMPIVQAVLPGINAIIAAFTELANVFAKVTAMLFGKSTQVKATTGVEASAGAAADATDKLADATAGAGEASKKAAKDMKGVQAGFDELNILAGDAASSMKDAAGGMDLEGAGDFDIPEFEADTGNFEEFEKEFSSLGELFVDTLDKMLAAMPDFRAALLDFANSFNEFNQKLYDAFTFPGVVERVEKLGRELASAFNDLVNAIDWELWGRTLGAGLNLGLQFLTEFIYTFDWINLGKKLAEFINGLVYEVDWYDFGRLLWAQFKIGLETFAGFFTGLDMPALAQAASNIIMGFFNSMQETIANIDWGAIGRQIAEFLNNIDWIGVITSIAAALKSMVEAGLELIAGFIGNADTGTLIAAALLLGLKLLSLLLSKVITPIAKEIASNLIKKIADSVTKLNFASVFYTIGAAIGKAFSTIGTLLGNAFSAISTFAAKIASVVGEAVAKIGSLIAEFGTTIAGIGAIIGGVALAAYSFFDMWNNGFSIAKEVVMLLGVALAAVGAVLLGVPATVAAIIAGIVAVVATAAVVIHEHWDEIKEAALNAWEAIKDAWHAAGEWFSTNVVEPVREFFSGLWESIATLASEAWQKVQEIWSAVSGWFNDTVITPVKEFFSDLWEEIKRLTSEAWESVKSSWNEAAQWFNTTVVEPVKKFFTELWASVKKTASDAWESVKNAWNAAAEWFHSNITEPIAKFFSEAWRKIKESASEAWNSVKTGVQNFWAELKSWWSSNAGKYFTAEYWKDLGKRMVDGLLQGLQNIFSSLTSWASNVWETISGAFSVQKAKSSMSGGMNHAPRRAYSEYSVYSARDLPHLANGAVIPPNQQFAAILGDQRKGYNVEAPGDLIRQLVSEGVTEAIRTSGGLGNSGNMTVIMEIDGREFGRASYKYGTAERQRVGVRLTEART